MSSLSSALYIVVYLFVSASGLVFLKMSDGKLLSFQGVTGGVLYGLGFMIWYLLLTRLALSIAFPLAAGGLVIASQLAGYFVLKESLSGSIVLGGIFIVIGMCFVALGGGYD